MATRRSTDHGPAAVVAEERPALAWGSTPITVVVLAVVSAVLVLGHLFNEPMTRALAAAAGESSLRTVSLGWASVAILPFSALLYGATVRDLRLPRGVRVVLADRARRPGEERIPPWVLVGPSSRRWQWLLVIFPVVGLAWAVWSR